MLESKILTIGGIQVEVKYKKVKNLHLSVHPPEGNVKAVVPIKTKADKVHLFLVSRLNWIRRKQRAMVQQPRRTPRQFTDGESVFVWGKQYRIRVQIRSGQHAVKLVGEWLELSVRKGTDRSGRQRVLRRFYRDELAKEIKVVARKWEKTTNLKPTEYRIKFMYTKWGSCNKEAKRIWLNLELAKHPKTCLSYLLLHELLHLIERGHTVAFQTLLTKYLPGWKNIREELNNGFPGLPALESKGSVA